MMKRWMYGTVFLAFISVYSNPFDCDFEKDLCSWSIEGFRRISSNQSNSTGGWNDDKRINGKEWYLYFDATNESYATLKSIQQPILGLQCLNFSYRFSGSNESQIQVVVQDIVGANDSVIWEKSGTEGTVWIFATVEIDVQYSKMITILIRGRTGRSYSKIEIDDIVVKQASCLDCNFLDGLCSWKGNEWTVPKGVSYTVTECKSRRDNSVLTSVVEIYPGEKCLSFKYQTNDFQKEKVLIDVQSFHEMQWSKVWSSPWQHQFQGWKEIGVDINLGNKSRIAIRFAHSNCSNATYYISSISLKKQSCTESTKFTASPTTVIPFTTIKDTVIITNTRTITTIVTLTSTEIATTVPTSTEAMTVTTSTYSVNDGVILGIVIGCLSLTVAVLLVATYLYRRRRATRTNANISKNNTVSSYTCSRVWTNDNGDTKHSTERRNQASETVPYNAQAQSQLLDNDGNNVMNPVQTQDQYHESADKEGTNTYDTMHNTYNHTKEFRDDTYDSTILYPKTIPNTTYNHTHFKRSFDNTYDHTNLTQFHTCDTTLQLSIQDCDPTYDYP